MMPRLLFSFPVLPLHASPHPYTSPSHAPHCPVDDACRADWRGLGGWQWWERKSGAQASYLTATVQRGDIEDVVTATGLLQPRDYVDVGAQVSGQLTKIHVEVGSDVQAGQLLAEIGAEQSAARVKANRASLRAQRATLAQRQVELVKAERDLRRQKNLMADEATTAEAVQNAETTVLSTRAQIQSLEAQIEQADATMQVEEANLKYAKIYAPMPGTVVSVSARQGQTLNANQAAPTLLRIADLSTMTVQAQVSEADVSRLRVGMPVYFTTLGSGGQRWQSTLKKVEPTPAVTNNVVLYNALFDVPNPQRRLMSQMTAQVFFVVAQARGVLTAPMAGLTIQRGQGGGPRANAGAAAGAAGGSSGPATGSMPAQGGAGSGAAQGSRPDWQNLSAEERERLRAERRAANGNAGGGSASGAWGGGNAAGPAPSRRATAKVLTANGVQEREVQVGVSSRVLAEILSGLEEGDRVVTGQRQGSGAGAAGAASAGAGQRSGAPGGMPPR
ncbi:efflux RND transporter periplasmic adaptor subunit [Hylemonella gracilis]|uniref:efflux RND transporter periplasmic adaptor subunit n=1 Tax=Hylemonella gracilis TaxID=80880 RepID=UPI001F60E213|nr:efflux RND transporter periplasmic adaptor subunit [Hylemonella gracilis]